MKFIAIIPARYASTRFPGKPLALLGGRPVIQHVYEKAAQALGNGQSESNGTGIKQHKKRSHCCGGVFLSTLYSRELPWWGSSVPWIKYSRYRRSAPAQSTS